MSDLIGEKVISHSTGIPYRVVSVWYKGLRDWVLLCVDLTGAGRLTHFEYFEVIVPKYRSTKDETPEPIPGPGAEDEDFCPIT